MKRFLLLSAGALALACLTPSKAKAASENDCAIWICLPGGFPSGCGGAYSAFIDRLKQGDPPLPKLSSCTAGPNGEKVSGRYELGYERYESCDDGYVLKESQNQMAALCVQDKCSGLEYDTARMVCSYYDAKPREKPHSVKMWVSGDYLGQYFY